MSKNFNFIVNLATSLAIATAISLSIVSPVFAVTGQLQFHTTTGYTVKTTFSYDDASHPAIIRERGQGKTQIIESMQVSFYQPSGEAIASYDNIIDGVVRGNYFEFNYEPETQQLQGNLDLGGESPGEMYLKGMANGRLSLVRVEQSGAEKTIDIVDRLELKQQS